MLEISAMSLEERTLARIIKEFGDANQAIVADLLRSYYGREQERVCWNILELSKENLDSVRQYVEAARIDYRDILYWAEYFDNDPMIAGRDPKQLVEEILA